MTMRRLLTFSLALISTVAWAAVAGADDDPDCSRGLEHGSDEWSDATFASVAGEGISKILKTGHVIAQVWRLGPKTAYVIARLKLLDPAMDDLGLMVSAHVKDGQFAQLNELDPRICFGLTKNGEPDFDAIKDLDKSLRGHVTTYLRDKHGIDRTAVEAKVGPKIVAGGNLHVMVLAAYLADGRPVRRRILIKISRAEGTRLEDLTPN